MRENTLHWSVEVGNLVDGGGAWNLWGQFWLQKHFGCCSLGCDRQVGNWLKLLLMNYDTKSYIKVQISLSK